ncbi:MAG: GNAT family N-acetyltransferase [Myxococcaceae bacterium]|nr:GNAT family N-acetyltransferase [Myxococcaceae bacterium]
MSAPRIRPMVKADLEVVGTIAGGLVRLHHGFDPRRFFLEPGVEDGYRWFFSKQLGKPGVVLLVAEVSDSVVGYVYGSLESRDWAKLLDAHGAIHDVFVDPGARRQGVARALMEAAVSALEGAGAAQVVLSSASQNVAAQALFRAMGFRETMVEMTFSRS